ncbi:MAG: NAD(P)/FAD-dependent oxidoreductase [Pseudomonadota bacterium]
MAIDTIIIGAGFAGVTAARELSMLNQKVVLLEARDRLGGRTWTSHLGDKQIELGGAYVHHTQPFVWSEIQRYGLDVTPITTEHFRIIYFDGQEAKQMDGMMWAQEMMPIFQHYFEASFTAWPFPYNAKANWDMLVDLDHQSALERIDELDLTPMQRITLISYLESCSHNKIENTSYVEMMRWFALSGHNLMALSESVGTYKLVQGTKSLINAIASDVTANIQLSTQVVKVKQTDTRVQVCTESGNTMTADNVLIAVPMNVVTQIEFSPELQPARAQAANEKHSGAGFKVMLKVMGDYAGIWCASEVKTTPLNSVLGQEFDGECTLMVGFGYSEAPINLNDHQLMQRLMRQYLPEITVLESTGHNWVDDPFSKGTWCSYQPGQLERFYDGLRQEQGRVYFAGSDLANGWRGFIDGAIESGITSARRLAG